VTRDDAHVLDTESTSTLDTGVIGHRVLIGRWLMVMLDGLSGGLLGLLIMAVTPKHQRLGDLAAHTIVVRA
jgi:uncharacterized RDD family membrane protein YckC